MTLIDYDYKMPECLNDFSNEQLMYYISRPVAAREDVEEGLAIILRRLGPIIGKRSEPYMTALGWRSEDADAEALELLWDICRRRLWKPIVKDYGYARGFHKFFAQRFEWRLQNLYRSLARKNPIYGDSACILWDGEIEHIFGCLSFREDYIRKLRDQKRQSYLRNKR